MAFSFLLGFPAVKSGSVGAANGKKEKRALAYHPGRLFPNSVARFVAASFLYLVRSRSSAPSPFFCPLLAPDGQVMVALAGPHGRAEPPKK